MNLAMLLISLLGLIVIGLIFFVVSLSKRIHHLTQGSSAGSLESIITSNNQTLDSLQHQFNKQQEEITNLQEDAMNNIQHIGVIRFNPFKETGGSQSFAMALTDKNNNGVVISSLYARDRMNVFVKPLIKGTSEYTLTPEEQQAIKKSTISK